MDVGLENFADKDAQDVSMWLKCHGIPDQTCELFEGIIINLVYVYNY